MERYINADKALEFIKETNTNYHWLLAQYNAQWVYDFIESQPTADVVPKSEVDKLEYTLLGVMYIVDKWLDEDELKQNEVSRAATMREKTLRIIETLKTEYAKEIFAEIEDAMQCAYDSEEYADHPCPHYEPFLKTSVAEIKKKFIP